MSNCFQNVFYLLSLAKKKNSYRQNFSIVNQSIQCQTLLSMSKSMRKNVFTITEIQKQTIRRVRSTIAAIQK
jgi:hypothetical protein